MLVGASLLESLADGALLPETTLPTPVSPVTEKLAQAIRACDLEAAGAIANSLSEDRPDAPAEPALVLGLAAGACGQHAPSLEILREASGDNEFEDWRLFGIAQSSFELGQYPLAKAALDSLLDAHPDSPLFAETVLSATELAQARDDLRGVAELARQSRRFDLDPDRVEEIEVAAWHAGVTLDDQGLRREVAARLLVDYPITASKLKVIEEFRAQDGSLDWPIFLSSDQLVRRAESLLDAGLRESALDTLDEVADSERSLEWRLVSARALTASKRGQEALAILDGVAAPSPLTESRLEWRRAFAAFEASRARPGRNLNELQRQMMRDRAHGHLDRVVELGEEPQRAQRALRLMAEDALEDDRFDEALVLLERLKEIAPQDWSGARELWEHGWKEQRRGNYSGAIAYWAKLAELYPTSNYNRSGLYWSARAYEVLGDRARARELLEAVAAAAWTDFYGRQALRRLGMEAAGDAVEPTGPAAPWPADRALDRATRLATWGLDRAALLEIDGVGDRAEPRAINALRSLVLSASGEWRQSIIAIKRVYPLLGSPFQERAPDRARRLYYPLAFDEIIEKNAERNSLDPNLVLAMIRQESAFDAGAHSRAGARGLMQVMPATGREIARRLGLSYSREKLIDPSFSVQLGTTYYRQVRSMFGDDELALAGYNAGPYRIKRLWRAAGADAEFDRFLEDLAYEETRWYVKRVLLFADSYRRLYSGRDLDETAADRVTAG